MDQWVHLVAATTIDDLVPTTCCMHSIVPICKASQNIAFKWPFEVEGCLLKLLPTTQILSVLYWKAAAAPI
jgi:hypothetical protein